MRYVELRRHTDNDGDTLTAEGVAAAETIGRDGLHPPYAAFVSSGAGRATQLLEILRRAAGQDDLPITEEPRLRSPDEEACVSALRGIVDGLPEDGRGLVAGHTPTNEAAVLGLTGATVPPLRKGEGVLVIEDRGTYRVEPLQ